MRVRLSFPAWLCAAPTDSTYRGFGSNHSKPALDLHPNLTLDFYLKPALNHAYTSLTLSQSLKKPSTHPNPTTPL